MDNVLSANDYATAAKVLDHLNRKLGYTEDSWWSPDDLNEVAKRVDDFKGRRQIQTAVEVIRAMNTKGGGGDNVGYCADAIRFEVDARG